MRKRLMGALCLAASLGSSLAASDSDALFRRRSEVDIRVFSCAPSPNHRLLSSRSDVDEALKTMSTHCEASHFRELRAAFLASVERSGIRWAEESLVVVQDWYGTGMAKASLDLTPLPPDAVRAAIRWSVPPPPVTPDTATCRFAFTVLKHRVQRVEVTSHGTGPTVLRIAR